MVHYHSPRFFMHTEFPTMDRQRLIEIASAEMADSKVQPTRERGYIYHHGRRVAALAEQLAATLDTSLNVSADCVFAAGLFHDLAKGTEPHHTLGAEKARPLLAGEMTP